MKNTGKENSSSKRTLKDTLLNLLSSIMEKLYESHNKKTKNIIPTRSEIISCFRKTKPVIKMAAGNNEGKALYNLYKLSLNFITAKQKTPKNKKRYKKLKSILVESIPLRFKRKGKVTRIINDKEKEIKNLSCNLNL